jgi:hypothetical protein
VTTDFAVAAALLGLSLAAVIQALSCLADHLLPSAAIYALGAATLAGVAGKLALDAI